MFTFLRKFVFIIPYPTPKMANIQKNTKINIQKKREQTFKNARKERENEEKEKRRKRHEKVGKTNFYTPKN